jgi:hypothetical protein
MVDPWIDITKSILAHPTIEMAVALHNNSVILSFWNHLSEHVQALLGGVRLPDYVIASTKEADLQPCEPLEAFRCHQVDKVRQIASNTMRRYGPHPRKMSQEVHVNAVKELVELGVRRMIEVHMASIETERNIALMADC